MDERQRALDMLREFDTAMLITHGPDGGLGARPMQVAGVDADGRVWFLTGRHTRKMEDLDRDARVTVVCQDGRQYLTLSGDGAAVADAGKVRQLWKEPYRTWFTGGPDDPDLVLLSVRPREIEYWDNAGLQGVKYVAEAARAYVAGERPRVDEGDQHGRASLAP